MKKSLSLFCLLLFHLTLLAQTEIITLDSSSWNKPVSVGYDKKLSITIPIEEESVANIFVIKKHKYYPFDSSFKRNGINSNGSVEKSLPKKYYKVFKQDTKNILQISIEDTFMLKPSSSYYFVIFYNTLPKDAQSFLDAYYSYDTASIANRNTFDSSLLASLTNYTISMRRYFGTAAMAYFNRNDFLQNRPLFDTEFRALLLPKYTQLTALKRNYQSSISSSVTQANTYWPNYEQILFKQLFEDTLLTKQFKDYITAKELKLNSDISDLTMLRNRGRLADLITGAVSLSCIFCERVNIQSETAKDISKRQSNISQTINSLNEINRALTLIRLKPLPNTINIDTVIARNIALINILLQSSADIKEILLSRKSIENTILENTYLNIRNNSGEIISNKRFLTASVFTGNTYLNFETRNKVMITPDFGFATSAFSKEGKNLEYGIIPYLGFHINFMAVDKDIEFPSYKKHWKQRLSFMVGWSMVSLKNRDSSYRNFFEKSSLLSGFGFRLSNSFRITTGTQWLFKYSFDSNNNEIRKLRALPYVGLSIDFNVKQYLNGFIDILSGISKTKSTVNNPKTNSQ
jgi:hypothetical protein